LWQPLNATKRLRHLMCIEEQWLHTQQICNTNQTMRTTRGLSAISIAHPDGSITHQANKTSMEEACLEEAWACFTQANDTPFLTTPLVNKLGLLNCHDDHFDKIASGQYHAPKGTELGAWLLLQNWKWPLEVLDCDLTLSETNHSDGLEKAKEWTASSLSGTHFGHYKAGTHKECINVVHTALLAIPLKTGFSYNRWKKGINIMLEKSPGNFQVDKLQIILLFKVDFNQLNKHVGQVMMHHAEQHSMVTR